MNVVDVARKRTKVWKMSWDLCAQRERKDKAMRSSCLGRDREMLIPIPRMIEMLGLKEDYERDRVQ